MFGLSGVWLRVAEFAVLIAFLFGAYVWVGHNAVEDYKTEQVVLQAKADAAQQAKYNKLAEDYEKLKSTRQGNVNTITRTYEKVIEKPIYSTVCIEPSGLQLANEAIAGKPSSQLDAKVPSNQTP